MWTKSKRLLGCPPGAMSSDGNQGSRLHYKPNSYGEWSSPDFNQSGDLFRLASNSSYTARLIKASVSAA